MTATNLPDYKNPPVTEVILGVQFDRIPGFASAHAGAFWQMLGPQSWPHVNEAPLIAEQFERFGSGRQWGRGVRLQFTREAACRSQFKNAAKDQMIQLQHDRLHANWIGGGEDYPRFPSVRASFVDCLTQFSRFLETHNLPHFSPNQWEVTYINTIPRGTVWNDVSEWTFCKLLSGANCRSDIESCGGEWHFVIPEQQGRLHVQWQHSVKGGDQAEPDQDEYVRLTLTARGPAIETIDNALEGIDLGRKTIVTSFRDFMTPDANKYWGLDEK